MLGCFRAMALAFIQIVTAVNDLVFGILAEKFIDDKPVVKQPITGHTAIARETKELLSSTRR